MPGPPPLPTETKRVRGTLRKGRDGPDHHAVDDLPADAVVMPGYLQGDAAALWAQIVPSMASVKIIRNVDVPYTASMCYWFGKFKDLSKRLDGFRVPADLDEERHLALIQRQTESAWKNFALAASRLGFTPSDRAKIRSDGGGGNRPDDPLSYFGISVN